MDEIAWFRTADSYLGIFGWHDLAEDANLDGRRPAARSAGSRSRSTSRRREAVDAALDEAVAAGGSLLKPGTELPVRLRRLLRRSGRPRLGGLLEPALPDRARTAGSRSTDVARPRAHRAEPRSSTSEPDVVHDRLLQLAARLRDELPPVEPGTQAATALGVSGRLDVEIRDRGPSRIELRTTQGRIRGEGAVDLARPPTARRTSRWRWRSSRRGLRPT